MCGSYSSVFLVCSFEESLITTGKCESVFCLLQYHVRVHFFSICSVHGMAEYKQCYLCIVTTAVNSIKAELH